MQRVQLIEPFDAHCCHMGTAIKHPVMLRAERQSARMSKITNDGGLTRSGTGCFISCTHMATVGVEGINTKL